MELVFIRHGHAEHLLDYPNRLNTLHPGLTDHGVKQVKQLRDQLLIGDNELVVVSPTRRTIQTAALLTRNQPFHICPLVGPRMFPQNPENTAWLCDQIYTKEEISERYPKFNIVDMEWRGGGGGINTMDPELFQKYGMELLHWCKTQGKRSVIVSHDGTITQYRILLGEQGLTRKDFLGEAGIYSMRITI